MNDDACTNDCREARCGDGIPQAGEACDDGNRRQTDACLDNCELARCGDGVTRNDLQEGDEGAEAATTATGSTRTLAPTPVLPPLRRWDP